MSPLVWAWLLSLAGAALFFAAGSAWSMRRSQRAATTLQAPREDQLTAAHAASTALSARLAQAEIEHKASETELARLRAERERAVGELTDARAGASELGVQLELARGELARLRQRAVASNRAADLIERAPAAGEGRGRDAAVEALRQELALTLEALRAQDIQLERQREENARLRTVEHELEQSKREAVALAEEARRLRARAFLARPAQGRSSGPPSGASGRALQSIVDAEIGAGKAKSAVIADELGLLVAASGADHEYGDALAACGAYLADVGAKTRSLLPLHEVRQVSIRDDHDVTLTVRPLAGGEHSLALVTLAVQAEQVSEDPVPGRRVHE